MVDLVAAAAGVLRVHVSLCSFHRVAHSILRVET